MNGEEERNLYDQILPFARAVEVSIDSVVVTDLFTLSLRVCVCMRGGEGHCRDSDTVISLVSNSYSLVHILCARV